MPVLAIDLGGTKLATAIFSDAGKILHEEFILLGANEASGAGDVIRSRLSHWLGMLCMAHGGERGRDPGGPWFQAAYSSIPQCAWRHYGQGAFRRSSGNL